MSATLSASTLLAVPLAPLVGAALAGQGIAIGRAALVLDDLASGRLVAPFGRPMRARAA